MVLGCAAISIYEENKKVCQFDTASAILLFFFCVVYGWSGALVVWKLYTN